MLSGASQSAVLLIVLAAYYGADFVFIAVYDRQRDVYVDNSGRNWPYTIAALIAGVFIVLQPWLLPALGVHVDGALGLVMQITGFGIITLSFGLQWWSRFHLRHHYSERVQVLDGHQLIDTGPYRYIRHPIFSSFFMLMAGMILANPSLLTLVLAIYVYWDFYSAAKREEVLLSKHVPGYAAYIERTSRFFPSADTIHRSRKNRAA